MTSSTQTSMADAGGMPTMVGMEHPEVALGVPPLVDTPVVVQFCEAIQSYADGAGFHDDAAARILQLRFRLANLRNLAQLCRQAILGLLESYAHL